jgi:phasin family protein
MYPNQPITPAAKSHLNAQWSFVNDMSKTIFRSAQKITELNIDFAQTLMEESTQAGQEILSAKMPVEILSSTAEKIYPLAEKMRTYQRYLTRIAADAQVDLSKCAEEHVQETSQTAQALADEVIKMTTEEIETVKQRQLDAVQQASDQINEFQNSGEKIQHSVFSSKAKTTGNGESHESSRTDAPQSTPQSSAASGAKQGSAQRKES